MASSVQTRPLSQLVLDAETAAELMTPNPVSIQQDASLEEAADLLLKKDLSALPVLGATGQPVGVLSRTDIVRYFRARAGAPGASVRQVMAPAFLAVPPATSALEVVAQLLGLGNVHRLYVVEGDRLVGVVSARDVLRRLRRPQP